MFPFMPTAVIDRDSFLAAQEATFASRDGDSPPEIEPEPAPCFQWAA